MGSRIEGGIAEPERLSAAVQRIKPSAVTMASQRARELKAQGRSIVDLTAGEPDFETPAHVCDAAVAAMRAGQTRYTTVGGTIELRQAIARKFKRDNGLEYAPAEIFVGAGAKQVLFNALVATVEPGDEVIVLAPCWVAYPEMVRFTGGKPIMVAQGADGFGGLLTRVEKEIRPRTKWLMINSPNNPSGAFFGREELRALADLLLAHPHVWAIVDDIYEQILFDGRKFVTLAEVEPRLKERTLTINGVSKAYSMTGWRIGYAGGPQALIRAMAKIQSQSTSAPCSVSQAAALAALDGPQGIVRERCAVFQRRRDLLLKEFASIRGMRPNAPQGAFYLFLDCSELIGRTTPQGETIASDEQLVTHFLMRAGVALVHGTPFSAPGYLRLSFAASEENLLEACRRLRAACGEMR
ncbi:MAG: pyridoxal phosphate-dependent aminotransferase [Rhodospirillaceae bacterium]